MKKLLFCLIYLCFVLSSVSAKTVNISDFYDFMDNTDSNTSMVLKNDINMLSNWSFANNISINGSNNVFNNNGFRLTNNGILNLSSIIFNDTSLSSFGNITNNHSLNALKGDVKFGSGVIGDGTFNVKGAQVVFGKDSSLSQSQVNISKGHLAIFADSLKTENVVNNAKNGLYLDNGELKNVNISGKGSTYIQGHVVVDKDSLISQKITIPVLSTTTEETVKQYWANDDGYRYLITDMDVYLAEHPECNPDSDLEVTEIIKEYSSPKASLTASANSLLGTVVNNAGLTLLDGTITKAISGTGGLTIDGIVENIAKIAQNSIVVMDSASFKTNAGLLDKNITFVNLGDLYLTGGNLSCDITGDGMTYIEGAVGNKTYINSPLTILPKGLLLSNASLIYEDIVNNGILQLSAGTFDKIDEGNPIKITGSGHTQIVGKVVVNSDIEQSIDVTKKGTLKVCPNRIKGNVINEGTLNYIGGYSNYFVQNSNKMNIEKTIVAKDIDNWANLTIKDSVVTGVADDLGLIENYKNLTFVSSNYEKNVIENNVGVVIYNSVMVDGKKVYTGNLTVSGSAEFKNNVNQNGNGGVIFNDNNGSKYAPKVVLKGNYDKVWLNDASSFTANDAANGGAIYNNGGVVDSKRYVFKNNNAQRGGAIYNNENSTLKLTTSAFSENNGTEQGGAIYNSGSLIDKNGLFMSNTANNGGAVYNNGNTVFNGTQFYKNGGTIADDCKTVEGDVAQKGGAISNSGILTLKNTQIGKISYSFPSHIMNNVLVYPYYPSNPVKIVPYGNVAELGGGLYNSGIANLAGTDFSNNLATENGGAVYNNIMGVLTVKSSGFYSNIASQKGGAIYNENDINVVSSTFDGNSAVFGGALYTNNNMNSKQAKIDKSDFCHNKSTEKGGAIYINTGNVLIKNSKIGSIMNGGNTAENSGGGIFNNGTDTQIISSYFAKNSAKTGGDIYNTGKMTISKTSFGYSPIPKGGKYFISIRIYPIYAPIIRYPYADENTTFDYNGEIYYPIRFPLYDNYEIRDGSTAEQGGSIFNQGEITITSSKFGYSAALEGAAIYNDTTGKLTINSTTFNYNDALVRSKKDNQQQEDAEDDLNLVTKGGAIYNKGYIEIKNKTKFVSNTAESGQGGAIYNDNSGSIDIFNTTFNKNNAQQGGAVYNTGTLTTDNKTKFTSNIAEKGGALYLGGGSATTINGTEFKSNQASYNDGSTYEGESIDSVRPVVNANGGAIYADNATLEINKAKFTSNTAKSGFNYEFNNYGDEEIGYTSTIQNEGAGCGGAIYLTGITSAKIDGTTFKSNSANYAGGAIYNQSLDNIVISNSTFTSNSAMQNISTEYIDNDGNSSKANAYNGKGGAIYNEGNLKLTNVTFTSNKAGDKGGAVYNNSSDVLTIENCKFNKNTAKSVFKDNETYSYYDEESGKTIQSDVSGTSYMGSGGAIYNENGTINITNTTFTSNQAGEDSGGGAIYNENGTINIYEGTKFTSNSAKVKYTDTWKENGKTYKESKYIGYGGAIFNSQGFLNIQGSKDAMVLFKSNQAGDAGGAIYNDDGQLNINYAKFESNKSVGVGGALFLNHLDSETATTHTISNSVFSKNSAVSGGAIFLAGGHLQLADTSFTNNTAKETGGAIYAGYGSIVDIFAINSDVIFKGNKANGKSNAIHLEEATLNLQANDGRTISIFDNISGTGLITKKGNIYIANEAKLEEGSDITIKSNSGSLVFGNENNMNGLSIQLSGESDIITANNSVRTLSLNKLTLSDNTTTNVSIDMDLQSGT
ncbi:MAG: hypothetical protein NC200_00125, partial [Candidatus Gastranaerophilales bacterium]|nr:hypothetical protein [Candidatus Gastranaerophilales bacterium]